MPLIHHPDDLPDWCEMHFYEILTLSPGQTHICERVDKKEKIIVDSGKCQITWGDHTVQAEQGTNLDLMTPEHEFVIGEVTDVTTLLRVAGDWGEITGGSGVWRIENSDDPHDKGDPVDYLKETNFDSHYHDYDEYWIFFSGRGIAVSEGVAYEVGAGDCIATGMGHHHDLPRVFEPIRAAFFETTVGGQGRRGHLWNHTHGIAQPQPDRI